MPFCTSCGKEIPAGNRFCEYCGAPVAGAGAPEQQPGHPLPASPPAQPLPQEPFVSGTPPVPPSEIPPPPPEMPAAPSGTELSRPPVAGAPSRAPPAASNRNMKIAAAAIAALVILAVVGVIVLPRLGTLSGSGASPVSETPSVPATIATLPPTTVTTAPTPTPDPFPDAYSLKEWFSYNEGKYASKATVYRYWINDTYQWHNDKDNRWYTEPQKPDPENKYLFVYVDIVNLGTDAYPYPKSDSIRVWYDGKMYGTDPLHYIPDKAGDRDATPIEIGEIQGQPDFFNSEYVEDYGYSHGTTSDFVYPGQSNAIDGYLIYKVPVSLTPDKTYVMVRFDTDDSAVWKLA